MGGDICTRRRDGGIGGVMKGLMRHTKEFGLDPKNITKT